MTRYRTGKPNPSARVKRPWLAERNIRLGKLFQIDECRAREIFEDYKQSKMRLSLYAEQQGVPKFNLSVYGLTKLFKRFFPDEFQLFIESKMCYNYVRGRNFEYRVRNLLLDRGYFVTRSPQSRGPADLVAIKLNEVLLVQCKITGNFKSPKEKMALISLASSIGAKPILAGRIHDWGHKFPISLTDCRTNEPFTPSPK